MRGIVGFLLGKVFAIIVLIYVVTRFGFMDEFIHAGKYFFDGLEKHQPAIEQAVDEIQAKNLFDGTGLPDVGITFPFEG